METRSVKDVLFATLEELEEAKSGVEIGSDEYKAIISEIHKVTNDLNEISKIEVEAEKNWYQQDKDRKDRWIRIVEIGVKYGVFIAFGLGAFYFEKTDSFQSTIGRRLFGNLLPKI